MPLIVPGQSVRTLSYASPPGGIVAAQGFPNTFSSIYHFNPAAFTVNAAGTAAQYGTSVNSNSSQVTYVGNGPALYVPGNAPRVGAFNVWGMGLYNVDLSLRRTFHIWESVNFQFGTSCSQRNQPCRLGLSQRRGERAVPALARLPPSIRSTCPGIFSSPGASTGKLRREVGKVEAGHSNPALPETHIPGGRATGCFSRAGKSWIRMSMVAAEVAAVRRGFHGARQFRYSMLRVSRGMGKLDGKVSGVPCRHSPRDLADDEPPLLQQAGGGGRPVAALTINQQWPISW